MKDIIFVSVAFGEQYLIQQDRLKESILSIYSDANLLFYRDVLPPDSPAFLDSLYAFKVYAVESARKIGFQKILWLDPAMLVVNKIDDVLKYPIVAVKDEHKLRDLISEKCLRYYGLSKQDVEDENWYVVGGSMYFFDFSNQLTIDVFNLWHQMEKNGLFGSQKEAASEQINGHKYDESCLALALQMNGVAPVPGPDVRYCCDNPIFIKKHFR